MHGYQYFVCGHVQQIMLYDTEIENYVYLMADVLSSQRQSKSDMYKTYLIVKKDGQIHTAHCTCMAGTGKACSHTAAVAYKVEAAIRTGLTETASTSVLCKWNDMSRKKAQHAPMSEINFKRPKYGDDVEHIENQCQVTTPSACTPNLASLKIIQPDAVVFSSLEVKSSLSLPPSMFEIFKTFSENDMSGGSMLSGISQFLNAENISNLEQQTIKQSKSQLWRQHRKGRITSSKMHRVYTLRDTTSRDAVIKEILDPVSVSTPAMQYGLQKESVARNTYVRYQQIIHEKFSCAESGLVLNKSLPHHGASPDGIVECVCCGKGCLEIKCLKTYESGIPDPESDIATVDPNFPVNSDYDLKKSHKFYTQVQGHIMICELDYCDLYLWSKTKSLTVRVVKDDLFIEKLKTKLTDEYINHIAPAIYLKSNAQGCSI